MSVHASVSAFDQVLDENARQFTCCYSSPNAKRGWVLHTGVALLITFCCFFFCFFLSSLVSASAGSSPPSVATGSTAATSSKSLKKSSRGNHKWHIMHIPKNQWLVLADIGMPLVVSCPR